MPVGQLRGVIAAIVTPVDARGEPDTGRFVTWAKHLLAHGCDGLNVLGTTGEATSFSVAQRRKVAEAIARAGLPLDRMMIGTGAASVADAEELTKLAADLGFAGALVLPPFYYKGVPHDGVVRYLARITERSGTIPIYLYNFPALSGVAYDVDLVRRLVAEFGSRITGLKDSSGDLPYARQVGKLGIDVFPSNEANLMDARDGVFAGCISATANVNAEHCAKAYHSGDAAALELAVAIRKLLDGKALVPGVKTLVAHILRDAAFAEVLPPLHRWPTEEERRLVVAYEKLVEGIGKTAAAAERVA
jgi:4-hydroxy-tetrahydrodipicolinate synthase